MRFLKALKILMLGIILSNTTPLQAEIQSVIVRWNPSSCREKCGDRMRERFSQVRQFQSFNIEPSADLAKIIWNPEEKFSYRAIKRPMQRIGVGIDSMIVKARGHVKEKGSHIVLISEGDQTEFRLVSPDYRKPSARYLTLSPEVQEHLVEAIKTDQIVIIEGFLYQPHRSPPLLLIVERIVLEGIAQESEATRKPMFPFKSSL